MKNFLKNLFQSIFYIIRIIWAFLSYKAIYTRNELTAEEMHIEFHFRGRWYSPFYWIIQLAKAILFVFSGGLLSLVGEIRYDMQNNGENVMTTQYGTFFPGTSEFRRKLSRFLVTYSNLD